MRRCTDITLVLDRSGSMESIRAAMEAAVAGFLAAQRAGPDACVVSLVQFDDAYDRLFTAVPVADAPPVRLEPRGATALLDALGRAITETGVRLRDLPAGDRPDQVLVVVITDGQENASAVYDRAAVFEMIRHQRDRYAWEFVYLGANQDAIATAASLGFAGGSALNYQSTASSVGNLGATLSRATTTFRQARGTPRADFFGDQTDADQPPPPPPAQP